MSSNKAETASAVVAMKQEDGAEEKKEEDYATVDGKQRASNDKDESTTTPLAESSDGIAIKQEEEEEEKVDVNAKSESTRDAVPQKDSTATRLPLDSTTTAITIDAPSPGDGDDKNKKEETTNTVAKDPSRVGIREASTTMRSSGGVLEVTMSSPPPAKRPRRGSDDDSSHSNGQEEEEEEEEEKSLEDDDYGEEEEEEEEEAESFKSEQEGDDDEEEEGLVPSTRPNRRRKSMPRNANGVDYSMYEQEGTKNRYNSCPEKKVTARPFPNKEAAIREGTNRMAAPKRSDKDELDDDGIWKLTVYAAPPRGTRKGAAADSPGNIKCREMVHDVANEYERANVKRRREIEKHIISQFVFKEADETTLASDEKIRQRLRGQLHKAARRNESQGAARGKRKRRPSASKTTPRSPRKAKTSAAESMALAAEAENQSFDDDDDDDDEIPTRAEHSTDHDDESSLDETTASVELPRKRAKINHAATLTTAPGEFVPSSEMLTVYVGRGNFSLKQGNASYLKLLNARLADFEAGKLGMPEILAECLQFFSFVSASDNQALDDDDAAEKIGKDLRDISKKAAADGPRRKATRMRLDNEDAAEKTVEDRDGTSKKSVTERPKRVETAPPKPLKNGTAKPSAAAAADSKSKAKGSIANGHRPTVYGGTGVSGKEGNILFTRMLDSHRVEYMEAKNSGDKKTTEAIIANVMDSFRFERNGIELTPDEARAKIYKNIADYRILDKMLGRRTSKPKAKSRSLAPPPPPPVEPEIPTESSLVADYDEAKYFVEELAFHALASEELDTRVVSGKPNILELKPLPPPEPLPELPAHEEGRPKYSFYDKYSYTTDGYDCRIVHVDCSGLDRIPANDKEFIGRLMQRNDIFVLFEGLCRGLSKDGILMELRCSSTPGPAMKVRRYEKVVNEDGHAEYIEQDKVVGISVDEFLDYLNIQEKGQTGALPTELKFMDQTGGKEVTIDPSNTVLYMVDVDLTDRVKVVDRIYKSNFLLPEILPGGEWCMMHPLPQNSCPFVGPNLYVTPGGGYTQIHQDGHGTVDSGHSCISGFNEIIMFRRLPEQHKLRACSMMPSRSSVSPDQQARNMLYNLPHADLREDKPSWPTKETIDEMNRMNYSVSVFTMRKNQHLHIPIGCLHAFRKLTNNPLPETDCHHDIRREIVVEEKLVEKGSPTCVSIAFDWLFTGLDAEALNRIMASCMECQTLTKQYDTAKPLAIPETGILWHANAIKKYVQAIKKSGNRCVGLLRSDGGKGRLDMKELARGILPSLRYIAERDALDTRGITPHDRLVLSDPDDRNREGHVDPYGIDGFRCGSCSMELAHAYFRCDGCEYSGRDFNVCTDCYLNKKYLGRPHYESCTAGPGNLGKCGCRELKCDHDGCERKKPCSCTCHQFYHRRTRFFTDDEVREFISAAESLAEGKEIKYHEETLHRLRGKVMVRPGEAEDFVARAKVANAKQWEAERAENEAQKEHPIEQEVNNDDAHEEASGGDAFDQGANAVAGPGVDMDDEVPPTTAPNGNCIERVSTSKQVGKESPEAQPEGTNQPDENHGPGKPRQDSTADDSSDEGNLSMDTDEPHGGAEPSKTVSDADSEELDEYVF